MCPAQAGKYTPASVLDWTAVSLASLVTGYWDGQGSRQRPPPTDGGKSRQMEGGKQNDLSKEYGSVKHQ